jgi:hypothetical protein
MLTFSLTFKLFSLYDEYIRIYKLIIQFSALFLYKISTGKDCDYVKSAKYIQDLRFLW